MSTVKATIMVIEDEVLLLEAVTKKLQIDQYDVIGCSAVTQAIDYLLSVPELPQAIWLDYYLKDGTGLDFLKQLRANPKWKDIPVLVVSNSASEPKVKAMEELGIAAYILKAEHRLDEIIDILKKMIA